MTAKRLSRPELDSLCGRLQACRTDTELLALVELAGLERPKAVKMLRALLHTDRFVNEPEAAALADSARKRADLLLDGEVMESQSEVPEEFALGGSSGEYRTVSQVATGDWAAVYRAVATKGPQAQKEVCIKIVHQIDDADLMRNEFDVLEEVGRYAAKERLVLPSIPRVYDFVKDEDGRSGTVIEWIEGADLLALRQKPAHRNGVKDRFHLGWFLERALSGIGHLHKLKCVHGNIEPGNVMIADGHRVVLLDYCFAVRSKARRKRVGVVTPPFSAPEIERRESAHPRMDLYGLGMCAIYLLGGDPEKREIPKDLDPRFVRFLEELTHPDPSRRAEDAHLMAARILNIRRKVWGNPGFIPFVL